MRADRDSVKGSGNYPVTTYHPTQEQQLINMAKEFLFSFFRGPSCRARERRMPEYWFWRMCEETIRLMDILLRLQVPSTIYPVGGLGQE